MCGGGGNGGVMEGKGGVGGESEYGKSYKWWIINIGSEKKIEKN